MFATSVRVRPWSARSSPRSVGRVTVITPSSWLICIRAGTSCASSPRGPFTITRPGEIDTDTPAGTSMGFLPIRLIQLPDKANDLAADPALLCGSAGHQPVRGGQDRGPHAAEDAGHAICTSIDAAPG